MIESYLVRMEYHNNFNGQKTKFFKVLKAHSENSARLGAISLAQKEYKHGSISIESVECYVKV